jgi:HSP20 family protein
MTTSDRQDSGEMTRFTDHPVRRLREEVGAIFDRFFDAMPSPWDLGFSPDRFWAVDVHEDDQQISVRLEAPGFEAKDFDVQVRGNMLTIRAEHEQRSDEQKEGVRAWQERHARFQRTIPLSGAVQADKVEATYRNGVLELHLPRTEEAQRKQITVKG